MSTLYGRVRLARGEHHYTPVPAIAGPVRPALSAERVFQSDSCLWRARRLCGGLSLFPDPACAEGNLFAVPPVLRVSSARA